MSLLKKLFGNGISDTLQQKILQALNTLQVENIDPTVFGENLLKDSRLKGTILTLSLALPFPAKSLWSSLEQQLQQNLTDGKEVTTVEVTFDTDIKTHDAQANIKPLEGIKNIIAVASGKGGVGKSTTSVNLALALQQEGAQVGLLDADIYGPSIPTMLGVQEKPQTQDGKSMEPIQAYGLQLMSIGFLINPEDPMIWRGPIVTSTLTQLLNETRWQNLDYLVIDLPPGTGDVQLTLSQQIPVTGSVIVTTPQEVALIDAIKAVKMFEKVNIPVLGIIENMSTHICSQCGHEEAIFGSHGGEQLAQKNQVPLLGKLPLVTSIREQMDLGKPTVVSDPNSAITLSYRQISHTISSQIALKRRNYATAFPNIVIENN